MKVKSYILMLLCFGMIIACEKSKLMLYEGEQNIYFGNKNPWRSAYIDTAYYNFGMNNLQSDTVLQYAWVMGRITDQNRGFKIRIVKENTTSMEGRDYELPIADSLYIPAGARQRAIPIVFHRSPELYEKESTIEIELVENEFFGTNMKVHNTYASAYKPSAIRVRYTIADLMPKPPIWDANFGALGSYSRKKLKLFVENQELDYKRWYSSPFYSNSTIRYYAAEFQYYLNEEQDKGNVILDDDGRPMKMGDLSQ